MRKQLLSFLAVSISAISIAQTAPNFTANDCASVNHDLYTELNSGKVIVITWVMPCNSCIAGATAAQNAVNSFSTSNPGQVLHYVADDYANTTCAALGTWCTTNSINPNARFSNSSVNMTGYGTAGMPKVVVLGGTNHAIYYNVNNSSVNQGNITTAINTALAATTGINEQINSPFSTKISPNPVNNEMKVTFHSNNAVSIEIINIVGQVVRTFSAEGNGNEITIDTESLSNGSYFVKITNGKKSETVKFIIAH